MFIVNDLLFLHTYENVCRTYQQHVFKKTSGETFTTMFIKLCCLSWTRYWFSLVYFINNQYCYFSLYTIEPLEYLMLISPWLNWTEQETGALDSWSSFTWQAIEYLSCDVCCTYLKKCLYIFIRIIFLYIGLHFSRKVIIQKNENKLILAVILRLINQIELTPAFWYCFFNVFLHCWLNHYREHRAKQHQDLQDFKETL